MADLSEMLEKANKKLNKAPQTVQVTNTVPKKKEKQNEKFDFHRDEQDSPTYFFTDSEIEASTTQSVIRLTNLWKEQNIEREKSFSTPEDYITNANKIFKSYQVIRYKLDSSIAFLVGDILNKCKERFFNEEKKEGKRWVDFLKDSISFSVRQAYDFMSISNKLQILKNRMLSMEQLRALLTLHSSGFDLHEVPQDLEKMFPHDILNLQKQLPSPEENKSHASSIQQLSRIMAVATKLERLTLEFETKIKSNSNILNTNLGKKEKDYILSLKVKLQSILSMIDN